MSQNTLKPTPGSRKAKRRLGRGDGSNRGSFSGRGVKGQNARTGGGVRPGFEGGQTPLARRLPKLKGFRNPTGVTYQVVNVSTLNKFEADAVVDLIALYERNLISRKNRPVKLLGHGEIDKKLTVKVDACSEEARKKIEAKGGSVMVPSKGEASPKE
ncbi:50S ribosomal protein L15 [Candidatus Peregrinibacteria bacterium CG_4_9_14_0_2_um_filter_53_11]|nr:MAG: 50S ribosomal protein L15 [Candidatus Peregrinibacteria bacterium CG_4_9_14_0_2_um_filter_53_11]